MEGGDIDSGIERERKGKKKAKNGIRLNRSAGMRGAQAGCAKTSGKVREYRGMKDRVSASVLSPFSSGKYLAADESHFMPMSSRYIPLSELRIGSNANELDLKERLAEFAETGARELTNQDVIRIK